METLTMRFVHCISLILFYIFSINGDERILSGTNVRTAEVRTLGDLSFSQLETKSATTILSIEDEEIPKNDLPSTDHKNRDGLLDDPPQRLPLPDTSESPTTQANTNATNQNISNRSFQDQVPDSTSFPGTSSQDMKNQTSNSSNGMILRNWTNAPPTSDNHIESVETDIKSNETTTTTKSSVPAILQNNQTTNTSSNSSEPNSNNNRNATDVVINGTSNSSNITDSLSNINATKVPETNQTEKLSNESHPSTDIPVTKVPNTNQTEKLKNETHPSTNLPVTEVPKTNQTGKLSNESHPSTNLPVTEVPKTNQTGKLPNETHPSTNLAVTEVPKTNQTDKLSNETHPSTNLPVSEVPEKNQTIPLQHGSKRNPTSVTSIGTSGSNTTPIEHNSPASTLDSNNQKQPSVNTQSSRHQKADFLTDLWIYPFGFIAVTGILWKFRNSYSSQSRRNRSSSGKYSKVPQTVSKEDDEQWEDWEEGHDTASKTRRSISSYDSRNHSPHFASESTTLERVNKRKKSADLFADVGLTSSLQSNRVSGRYNRPSEPQHLNPFAMDIDEETSAWDDDDPNDAWGSDFNET